MKLDPLEQLREQAWRRPLTPAEQAQLEAWFAAHPEARADWEADAALSAALARLPEAAAPSNLTARVLAALERDDLATVGARGKFWLGWVGWVPRTAVAAAVVVAGVFIGVGVHHHQQQVVRVEAMRQLAAAAEVTPVPSPEVLQDLEVIRRINLTPAADVQLLALGPELQALAK